MNAVLLENILKKMGKCDLIKMDCEGSEFQIFETAPDSVFQAVPYSFLNIMNLQMKCSIKSHVAFESKGFNVKIYPSVRQKNGFLLAEKSKSK